METDAVAFNKEHVFEPVALLDPESGRRAQCFSEEVANSISHGVALLAMIFFAPILMHQAVGNSNHLGIGIFVAMVALVYLTSTLYHSLPPGKAKRFFRVVEHMAIFLLIAGTYTPFMLGVLRGPWGWTLLGLIWTLALSGVLLKAIAGTRYPSISMGLYLSTGWVVLAAAQPLWQKMGHRGFIWILLGGLAYTGGVLFYTFDDRIRFSHFIWHLFVVAGTVCHTVAVFYYAG